MCDGVVMSGGHCTHPTGGPAIRLKHKKLLVTDQIMAAEKDLNRNNV